MSEEQPGDGYVVRIRVVEGSRGVANALVWVELLDIDVADKGPQRGMAYNRYQTNSKGYCELPLELELLEQFKDGDGVAQLLLGHGQDGGWRPVRLDAVERG